MSKHIFVYFLSFISLVASAQVAPDSIKKALVRHLKSNPQEKIYLHIDRPHYAPGDTIWLKAYIVDAMEHLRDSISKNIYVELVRKSNGKSLHLMMLKNAGGFSFGDIALKDSLSEGVYEIHAFTNWMRNFPQEQFFSKEIYIRKMYEIKNSYRTEELNLLQVADLQFFPEGGNLVVGLQNRIGFKAVNRLGKGVDLRAFIISEQGDTVATIKSEHLGMGSFIFTPKVGEKYHARIEKSSKEPAQQKLFYLPQALSQGYAFFVDNLSNKDAIRMIARNNFATKDCPILIGQCRGKIIFSLQSATEGNSFLWLLKKNEIPDDGIVQLTLFNRAGVPQCERLIYNNTKSPLAITVSSDKTEYKPHEKVTLTVNVKDYQGDPVQGNFSLAVTDNQQVNLEKNAENINTYMYLSSDVRPLSEELKGEIEQPAYYFDRGNVNASVHLDILLLTQGWRRFLWNDVLKPSPVTLPPYSVETGINISGTAKVMGSKKLKQALDITMMYSPKKGDAPKILSTKTDLDGKFTFNDLNIIDSTTAFMQAVKGKGNQDTEIAIDKHKWPVYKTPYDVSDPFYADVESMNAFVERQKHYAEMEAEFRRMTTTKVLKEVVVSAKKEKKIDSRKALYDGIDATNVPVTKSACAMAFHVLHLLKGRVAGLEIKCQGIYCAAFTNDPIVPTIQSFGGYYKFCYLLDGRKIDSRSLSTINPCTVESIDVITHPVPVYQADALISILTKRANPDYDWSKEEEKTTGSVTAKIKGYEKGKEFYSPRYFTFAAESPRVPDFRKTIHWNPMVMTDALGNAKVTFWNSDEKTSVHVALEGISLEGTPGAAACEYNVN